MLSTLLGSDVDMAAHGKLPLRSKAVQGANDLRLPAAPDIPLGGCPDRSSLIARARGGRSAAHPKAAVQWGTQSRLSCWRPLFSFSASANALAPSAPMLLSGRQEGAIGKEGTHRRHAESTGIPTVICRRIFNSARTPANSKGALSLSRGQTSLHTPPIVPPNTHP